MTWPRLPLLITFDVFGTLVDWRAGLEQACRVANRPLAAGEFDRIVDVQGQLEQKSFRSYADITRDSLVTAIGMPPADAARIAGGIGEWDLFEDTRLLRPIAAIAPCAAMTNSDRAHGRAIQSRLGFDLQDWLCAEDVGVYKPDPAFWLAMARRRNISPGPHWWHVSAYADYDLTVANQLCLTTVFVGRSHARRGAATHAIASLAELAGIIEN